MDYRFIITLTEHRLWGHVFAPYLVRKEKNKDYYTVYDRVTLLNIDNYQTVLSPEENQLARLIEDYNDQNIFKLFSKKKATSRDFLASLKPPFIEEHIRPYIERRMAKCIDILAYTPVPVYHKMLQNTVYHDDLISVLEEEGHAVFNFSRSEVGIRYFLSIEHNGVQLKLTGKEGIVILNEPCCLILNDKMFVFRDIDGKKITPFFTREFIEIPPSAEKKFLEGFARNAIKKYKVIPEGFTITDNQSDPEPIISVEFDLTGRFSILLKFVYSGNTVYYANRKTEQKVTCEFHNNDVSFVRLQRNYILENECITSLLSLGLVNYDGPYFHPLQRVKEIDDNGLNIISWVNLNSKEIQKAGFSIAQEKLEKQYYLDDFAIKIEVSDKHNDWFDIDAHVEFAGFKIAFSSFTANILSGEREYKLPDGRILILPEEWFESYRDMLSFAHIDNGSIRLDKQHFPLLNRNINGLNGDFKNNLLNLIDTENIPEILPEGINATLRNYQLEGFSWMHKLYKNGFGGCLADDMGLGKTIQTLALLQKVITERGQREYTDLNNQAQQSLFKELKNERAVSVMPTLIVVPTSLVHNWINESTKFVPTLKIAGYVGGQRKALDELMNENDIIITSYGILRNDLELFVKLNFLYLILDESQMIKNPGSKTYQAVLQLKAENRLVLTGTPIENSLSDLWAQINFLNPGLLGNPSFFKSEFQSPIEKYKDEGKREKLRKIIGPFILRRSKSQAAPDLPEVNEQVIYCNLEEQQEIIYEREKSKARNLLIDSISKTGAGKSAVIVLQSLTKLRQIANHPILVDEHYMGNSGKFEEVTRNLISLKQEGHKTLIFSSFTKHLDLIAEFMNQHNYKYAMLTGETNDREKAIKKFQTNKDCHFFLISLKAGGVGLNLTAADYVIILDPWWNPAAELQAIARAHRIGQDKSVFVYRFITRNTLEEKIVRLQERKSELADAFVNTDLKNVTREQLMELFE